MPTPSANHKLRLKQQFIHCVLFQAKKRNREIQD